MKFFVDTAGVGETKDLAASGLLTDIGLEAFLDDWAKTGQSIL